MEVTIPPMDVPPTTVGEWNTSWVKILDPLAFAKTSKLEEVPFVPP
jgi:hypothetical protein